MQNYNIQTDEHGKELNLHGDEGFACGFYDELFSKFIGGYVPWHWHDELELVYVVKGSTLVECVEQSITLSEGDAVFINAGCLHKLTDVGKPDCHILNFVLSPTLIGGSLYSKVYKRFVASIINNESLPMFAFLAKNNDHTPLISTLNLAFDACRNRTPTYELQTISYLMHFWALFCELQPTVISKQPVSDFSERRLHLFLSYVHTHYQQNMSVKNISKAGNVSESECFRVFKKALKTTPNGYVLNYRLQQAAIHLVETNSSITEIAHTVGFNCPAYFTKRFKSHFNKTPKQFRATNQSNLND